MNPPERVKFGLFRLICGYCTRIWRQTRNHPLKVIVGAPASRRGMSAFAEGLPSFAMLRTAQRRDRQECGRGMPRPYE